MPVSGRVLYVAALVAVFGVALTFRLSMLALYRPTSPWVASLTLGDAEMGRNLIEGRGWTANGQLLERATRAQAGRPTMVDLQDLLPVDDTNPANTVSVGMAHSPGYSAWFAISYWLGGAYRYIYSQRMQAVLDAFAALLVVAIGARCWSRPAGVVGGLLYAVSPPHAFLGNLTVAAATDSFWFLLSAYGAVVTAGAVMSGRKPWAGGALVAAAAFGGGCMNSTPLVLPAVMAAVAVVLTAFDRRYLRVAAAFVVAQLVVFAILTPWALRNQRVYGQFSLVRGSFWQLAFAAWGELPNPWGLGFDDKEFFHWTEENCAGCSPGGQQEAMRHFLLSDVVTSAPFPRHLAKLVAWRLPRALDVARTPDGVLREHTRDRRAPGLAMVFRSWDRILPFLAMLAGAGLAVAVSRADARSITLLGLGPTLFLTAFSLLFYVELRKTVPGYGYLAVLAGIALAAPFEWMTRWTLRRSRPAAAAVAAGIVLCTGGATLRAQSAAVATGGELHSAIVNEAGEIWGWGSDLYGQIGDGKRLGRYVANPAAQAAGLQGAVAVAAGSNHTLALTKDGSVWGWGDNSMGQLGDGTRATAARPIRIPGLMSVRAISGGYAHSLALDADGTIWAWGSNLYGQLGAAGASESLTPRKVPLAHRSVAIATGWFFSLAIDDEGHVWAWGRNSRGQLGVGSTRDTAGPAQIPGLTGIVAVAAGHQHGVALASDGRLWCWGANDYGQTGLAPAGDGSAFVASSTTAPSGWGGRAVTLPRVVSGAPAARRVFAEADSTLALAADGTVWAWGSNQYGQLGDGTFSTRPQPARVVGLPAVVAVGAGHAHAVAVADDGTLWAWGFGFYGQLGEGLTDRRLATPRTLQYLRVREPHLDLAPANAMVLGPGGLQFVEPGVIAESGVLIRGEAKERNTYAVMARPVTVGPDEPWRWFYAQGRVRAGGITVGVLRANQWVFNHTIDVPGTFTILWSAPARMEATAVIAHHLPGASLTSDVEISSWGWLKSAPPGTR